MNTIYRMSFLKKKNYWAIFWWVIFTFPSTFLQSAPSVASCGVSSGGKATKRRMRMTSRRKRWRTTTGEPNTALKASWETDVSELLELLWLMCKWKIVGTNFRWGYLLHISNPTLVRAKWSFLFCQISSHRVYVGILISVFSY